MTAPPTLWDVGAVAQRLGTTERHVRQLVADRRIPFIKVGASLRFDPLRIQEWILENTTDALDAS